MCMQISLNDIRNPGDGVTGSYKLHNMVFSENQTETSEREVCTLND